MEERKTNILLIEDDEVDIMTVKRAFTKNNIASSLYIASNGLEALAMLRSAEIPHQRRLVLLDLNMPKMGGIEFLRELRGDPELKATPVIVLTTSNEEKDKVEAYNFNVAGYIVKPVTFSQFVEAVAMLSRYWHLNEMP